MQYEFNEDRSHLILTVDEEEQAYLRGLREEDTESWGTSLLESEVTEQLRCNSELGWIDPSDTGDLTDAPILGITGGDDDMTRECKGPYGAILGGGDKDGDYYYPILERWGYMSYQLRSFLDDLADGGRAVFVNSN